MKVEVHAERLMSDPAFVAYHVEIEHDGIWRETVGSEHDLTMLLRGLRAGWTMATGGYLPELPTPRPGDTHTVIGRAPEALSEEAP